MILKKVEFVGSAVTKSQFPDNNLAQIVFSGRSNVGKSSFINALLNRKNMARVSQTPGKTRLINFFLAFQVFFRTKYSIPPITLTCSRLLRSQTLLFQWSNKSKINHHYGTFSAGLFRNRLIRSISRRRTRCCRNDSGCGRRGLLSLQLIGN